MCCEHEEFNQTLLHATATAAVNYVQFYVNATVSVQAKQSIVNNQYIINISVGRIHTVTNQLPPVHLSIYTHTSWVNENMLLCLFTITLAHPGKTLIILSPNVNSGMN